MQKWRRGGKGGMPFSPTDFGIAIDICIRMLRRVSDEQFKELMNGINNRGIKGDTSIDK